MDRYATLRNGLIAAYCPSLGATGNILVDRVARARGTLVNMGGQGNWVAANGGLAIAFDGVDDRVEITLPSLTTNRFSIHGWAAYRTLPAAYAALVFTRQAGIVSGVFRSGSPDPTPQLASQWIDSPGEYNRFTDLPITINQWFRFAMVVNGETLTTWQNMRSDSLPITSTARNIGGTWNLGRDPFGTRFSNCLIDDVRFYSRALTSAEMSTLFLGRGIGLVPTRHRRGSLLSQFWCKVSGTWKTATPWINVGGTWKKGSPKIRAGVAWKG